MRKHLRGTTEKGRAGRSLFVCLAALLILGAVLAPAACITVRADEGEAVDESKEPFSYDDLKGKKVGVKTGTVVDAMLPDHIKDVKVVYFDGISDQYSGLKAGKVDAIAADEPVLRYMAGTDPEIAYRKNVFEYMEYGLILNKKKGGQLCEEINAFIAKNKEDGLIDEMQREWFDEAKGDRKIPDYESLPAKKGKVRFAIDAQIIPFTYVRDTQYAGYEVELMARFCEENDYALEISDMKFGALIPAVSSGKYDVGAACITITDERKKSVLFTDPTYIGGATLAVRQEAAGEKKPFWARIGESFKKTFLRESRYRLFLKGIGTTLLISALSALFGTLLGFLVFMTCRRGNIVANKLTAFYRWFMAGIPMVVLLMILYYIVFGRTGLSGTVIAVIGFTLVFGAEVCGMLMTAVGAVDPGQMEAACALGYTDRKAFFTHILPQAMPHFMPGYRGGLVNLIKATSIVGYVAVEDLTKMGDIVRSRTYEAFFPLIAVAVIYFILGGLLVMAANRLTLKLDPTRRSAEEILKGVEIHD